MNEETLKKQVGGNHYKKYVYQPIVFAFRMHYNPAQFSMLRYLVRWQDKNGLEDLEKIIHYTELNSVLGNPQVLTEEKEAEIHKFVEQNNLNVELLQIIKDITICDNEKVAEAVTNIIKQISSENE